MAVCISRPHLDAICAHARDVAPHECCGLLLGMRSTASRAGGCAVEVVGIRRAENVAADPENRFEVDPAVLIAAHRQVRGTDLEVVGHYHSHPRGEPIPSIVDAAMAQMAGEIWLLVGEDGAVRAWQAVSGGSLHNSFEPAELTGSAQGRLAPNGVERHEDTELA